jgi:hypothetical protein
MRKQIQKELVEKNKVVPRINGVQTVGQEAIHKLLIEDFEGSVDLLINNIQERESYIKEYISATQSKRAQKPRPNPLNDVLMEILKENINITEPEVIELLEGMYSRDVYIEDHNEGITIEELPLPVFTSEADIRKALDALLSKFTGPIFQVPPMYSALKRDGKPLYEYARAGVELERTAREITIHHIRWTEIAWPVATLEVSCSKGTYIRVLAEDIGNALGCGAHLVGLRRTEVGHLNLEQSFTIESIQSGLQNSSNYILPVDALLQTLPHLTVDEQQAKRLEMGQRVPLNLPSIEALVRIYRAR